MQEQIDTVSAGGRFYLHMIAALAEFERELIWERTKAGMQAVRAGASDWAARASFPRTT